MRAFEYVIETAGRRQVTDLHVRRLLNYVRAHDRNYTGVKVSLAQLASTLTGVNWIEFQGFSYEDSKIATQLQMAPSRL